MANRPPPEVEITPDLAAALLAEQMPELTGRPIELLGVGWDNTNWRLRPAGRARDELTIRMPHRAMSAPLILSEQQALPLLVPQLDLEIPVPTALGTPSESLGYPWHWSVTRWIPGVEAAQATLAEPAATAYTLGRFYSQLHVDAPADAPVNEFRGGPIAPRRPHLIERIESLGGRVNMERALAVFDDAANAPVTDEQVWIHGDFHTRNMLVRDGDLVAAIDWGDICAGDRAGDLAGAFMLVPDHVDLVADVAGADDDAWRRARGWAAHFAVMYLAHGDDAPIMSAIGQRLLVTLGIA